MKTSADLTRKAGIEERNSEIEGKTARVTASQSGSRASFNAGNPVPPLLASFFSIRNLCASYGLPDNRIIANDEMQMSNDEGMTKIQMPNLRKSVQSADDHLRDLCVLCGEK